MLFAQLPSVQPEFLHQSSILVAALISSLASIGGLVVSIIALRSKRSHTIDPQPLQVMGVDKFATSREVHDLHQTDLLQRGEIKAQLTALSEKVDSNRIDLESLMRSEVGAVHNRTNEVLKALAHLQGVVEELRRNQTVRRP